MGAHSSHNNHHGGRSRRTTRVSASHNNNLKQQRARLQKEAEESALEKAYMQTFEAARSFELEDDEQFCPFSLLTEDDIQSIYSSGSDRSSLSSGSPEQSPLQHQIQPSSFLLPASANPYTPSGYQTTSNTKLHQPLAQRTLKAIPIVNPNTRAVASPPPSVSPNRQMQQFVNGRW